jgi:cell division protein FtsW (lipid II flippase)
MLSLSMAALCSRTIVHRAAVREAEGATRIEPANVESILAFVGEHQESEGDAAFIRARIREHARDALAKKGPRGDLESLLSLDVRSSDLPPIDKAPLSKLRARLADRASVPVLDGSQRADALLRLQESRVVIRSPEELDASFDRALLVWALAMAFGALLVIGAIHPASRSPDLGVLAIGAFGALTVLGMTLLAIAVGPLSGPLAAEKAAQHVLIGVATSFVLLVGLPLLVRAARRFGVDDVLLDGRALMALATILLVVLAIFGHGPKGSAARINLTTPLGVFQPLEIVKLSLIAALAQHVGRHRSSFAILAHRKDASFGPWLLTLALPFVLAIVALIGSAWRLGDFGTVLVLAPTVALIIIAASGSVLVAFLLTTGALAAVPLLVLLPWPTDSKVFVRLMAWLVPEANGLPGGDQLTLAEQAIAAGGWSGAHWPTIPNAVPAGTTDLPVALLVERFGVVALVGFVIAELLLVFSGIAIGARLVNRRGEIRYVPMALAFLIAVQTAVALSGLAGLIPMSGIVTPFLSEGGTAMAVFALAALAIARYGAIEGGRPEPGDDPLPRGLLIGFSAIGACVSSALIVLVAHAVGDPHRLTDPVPTELADGRIAPRWSAHLRHVMHLIEPVPLIDRRGRPIAEGHRTYPFGAALAPLVGIARHGIAPLPGTLEAEARATFARFPSRATPAELVEACDDGCDQRSAWKSIGVVPEKSAFRNLLLDRLKKKHAGASIRMRPFSAPDFSALAGPLRKGPEAVNTELDRIKSDVPFARTTIDAALQADVYPLLVEAMKASKASVGAIVVRDAASGEILVRASGESIDPERIDASRYGDPTITGAFGSLRDFAAHYAVPPGSTFKPITALALLDVAQEFHPEACVHHVRKHRKGMQGNLHVSMKNASGWIADFGIDRPHGTLDLMGAIEESCNVYFAQAGMAIGPEKLRALTSKLELASFRVPDDGGIDLAAAAIGQGRTTMTAEQVSLAYAAIAEDGRTRLCPLLYGRDGGIACKDVPLTTSDRAKTIQGALRRVVTSPHGTGTRAKEPKGAAFTVYGKTGTAEQDLVRGESGSRKDHAWFAGYFEGAGGKKLAFSILLARAGTGGKAAAPLAPKLGALLEKHGYFDVVASR